MRTIVLALAVFVALTAFAAATTVEDFDEDSLSGFAEIDMSDEGSGSSSSSSAASSASSSGSSSSIDAMRKLKAPKSVPQMEMRDFGDETMRIKRKLERRRETLLKDTTDLKDELKELEKEEAVLMKRIHAIRQHARDAKKKAIARAKGQLSKEEKALQDAINEHYKGIDFVRELRNRVSVLHDAADRVASAKAPKEAADAKDRYAEARAWVKQSLTEGTTQFPTLYLETGVVDALQEIQDGYEAGVESDVDEADMKLYESGKLKALVKRMMDALRAKLARAKAALKAEQNKPAIPEHALHGLKEAEKELNALRKKAYAIQDKIDAMNAANGPALAKIDRELAKIRDLEKQVYHDAEGGSTDAKSGSSSSSSSSSSKKDEDLEEDLDDSEEESEAEDADMDESSDDSSDNAEEDADVDESSDDSSDNAEESDE